MAGSERSSTRPLPKSLDEGQLPAQWRNAKIIPLKKPGKGDYAVAKAWRPISLLSTLAKALESIVAINSCDVSLN
jgi:hypothetical protein